MLTVYYFSGTGNSLAAAEALTAKFPGARLVSILKAMEEPGYTIEGEEVGLFFPVYFLGVPAAVRMFIEGASRIRADYLFAVATKGWHLVGAPAAHVSQLLAPHGAALDACFHIKMASNDVLLAGVTPVNRWKRIAQRSERILDSIASRISRKARSFHPEPTSLVLSSRQEEYRQLCSRSASLFRLDAEKCPGCGLCVRSCTLGNIVLSDDKKPVRGTNCQLCEACYNICPSRAIGLGRKELNTRQFWHPGYPLSRLMAQKTDSIQLTL